MIEVDRLSKRFGPVTAVDELSFTVHPGQVTGFLGPNGAGKTTTMRVILGLDAPAAGWATVSGLLAARGAAVTAEPGGGLAVTGLDAAAIGDLAREYGISVHELTPRHASLEEAYMELTRDSVEYRAEVPGYAGQDA